MRWHLALAVVLIVAGAPAPSTAAAVETGGESCTPTEPGEQTGVEIKVYRGPVENSVALQVDKYDARQVSENSIWGIDLPEHTKLLSQRGFERDQGIYQPIQNRDV